MRRQGVNPMKKYKKPKVKKSQVKNILATVA